VHIGANCRIRRIDLCSGGDASCRYHYCGGDLLLLAPGATNKDGRLFTIQQWVRAVSIVVHYFGRDENIHVNGWAFILDFSGVGAKQLTHWSTNDMRNWMKCWQVHSLNCAQISVVVLLLLSVANCTQTYEYLPLDAMLVRYMLQHVSVSICVRVCHKSVFY